MNMQLISEARLAAEIVVGLCLGSLGLNAFASEPTEGRSKAVLALEALEKRTGKTADELLPAIEVYASMRVAPMKNDTGGVKSLRHVS